MKSFSDHISSRLYVFLRVPNEQLPSKAAFLIFFGPFSSFVCTIRIYTVLFFIQFATLITDLIKCSSTLGRSTAEGTWISFSWHARVKKISFEIFSKLPLKCVKSSLRKKYKSLAVLNARRSFAFLRKVNIEKIIFIQFSINHICSQKSLISLIMQDWSLQRKLTKWKILFEIKAAGNFKLLQVPCAIGNVYEKFSLMT